MPSFFAYFAEHVRLRLEALKKNSISLLVWPMKQLDNIFLKPIANSTLLLRKPN